MGPGFVWQPASPPPLTMGDMINQDFRVYVRSPNGDLDWYGVRYYRPMSGEMSMRDEDEVATISDDTTRDDDADAELGEVELPLMDSIVDVVEDETRDDDADAELGEVALPLMDSIVDLVEDD